MIDRAPHRIFAGLWFAWYACVWWALLSPEDPTLGLLVLVAFLPIEGAAVVLPTGSRDTLSELATWVWHRLSKHQRFARGWNAMMLAAVLTITYLLGRTIYDYTGAWYLAVAIGGLATVWLHDHWSAPAVHG